MGKEFSAVVIYGCNKNAKPSMGTLEELGKRLGCKNAVELGTVLYEDYAHWTTESVENARDRVNSIFTETSDRFVPNITYVAAKDVAGFAQKVQVKDSNPSPENPKDSVGVKRWRQFIHVPMSVLCELGVAMLEGGRKYGRANWRVAGVRASVYVDAAMGHIIQWWEGEDVDADSGLSHITKAIASLTVLRDAMIQDMLTDDRPPKANLDKLRTELQAAVDGIFERIPEPKPAFTEKE
jgi:hypothetical protein